MVIESWKGVVGSDAAFCLLIADNTSRSWLTWEQVRYISHIGVASVPLKILRFARKEGNTSSHKGSLFNHHRSPLWRLSNEHVQLTTLGSDCEDTEKHNERQTARKVIISSSILKNI